MIIRVEEAPNGRWNTYVDAHWVATGPSRASVIANARRMHRVMMDPVPLQPEEIPGELREIAKRMRAVSEPLIYFGGFGVRGDLGRSMEAQAPILAAWADLMDETPLAFPQPGA